MKKLLLSLCMALICAGIADARPRLNLGLNLGFNRGLNLNIGRNRGLTVINPGLQVINPGLQVINPGLGIVNPGLDTGCGSQILNQRIQRFQRTLIIN